MHWSSSRSVCVAAGVVAADGGLTLGGAAALAVVATGLTIEAVNVSKALSDSYIQQGIAEWVDDRVGVGIDNVVFARRSYGAWVDKLPRLPPKTGRPRWALPGGGFGEFDPSHGGEVEAYDKRGYHTGVLDPNTGDQIKPAEPGRKSTP